MAPQSQPSSEGQSQARDHPFLLLLRVGKVKKCTKAYRNITDQLQLLFFITFFCNIRFIFYSQLLKIRGMRGKPSSDLEKHKDTQSPPGRAERDTFPCQGLWNGCWVLRWAAVLWTVSVWRRKLVWLSWMLAAVVTNACIILPLCQKRTQKDLYD